MINLHEAAPMAEWLRALIFSALNRSSSHGVGSSPARVKCVKPSSACGLSGYFSRGSPIFAPPYYWIGSKWVKPIYGIRGHLFICLWQYLHFGLEYKWGYKIFKTFTYVVVHSINWTMVTHFHAYALKWAFRFVLYLIYKFWLTTHRVELHNWAASWQNKMWLCAQRRLRSAQSDQSLHCPHRESLGP